MPPPDKPTRRFSFFGLNSTASSTASGGANVKAPQLKLDADKEVYRPGDLITVTIEIKNASSSWSLLIEKLNFEIRGIEKLDTQWFTTPKPSPDSRQRRDVVRTLLPSLIPPSYRGATIRYLYYIKTTLTGQYLVSENGTSRVESRQEVPELEERLPLQIWVTQKSNGMVGEEGHTDGIVPVVPALLDVYWKELGADEWAKVNESSDGVEEGYESSRDEISSVSSYNPMKEDLSRTFGSSLSLQSFSGRSSNRGSLYVEGRASIASNAGLPRLSIAEVLNDSASDRSPTTLSPSQPPRHLKAFSAEDDSTIQSASVPVESGTSEGFVRGRSYNIRLDDQVLLRFSPKNSESTYYFCDMIGGTLTFFHEEGTRKCLELSVSLEMTETISRNYVHHSRRHTPTITKVFSDHHEVVADLVQTSFLFSIPMDGPMTFTTRYVSVQWALRFEFLTSPRNMDLTRYEHPLMIEGRDKCEWILPITVHAPPSRTASLQNRNDRTVSLDPLWVRT
ncbi:uncharacterized protein LOC131011175 isoform X2 [Salvia miltiorrhiza]|uniref:uncharacterized protein LOC131010163 isoform X2 n=1 Tax=Salvia miltiorrhiza TaxID=226208 RepID=UPI0025ACA5DF|nr:uncharacterized protein LOC131010163 isoform X2 [Salvia miltiorrhiza]XP_057793566.1 uncharacterized protein LOC131010163 isoform X2 [Salvia miltiorrhiza]XP_057794958.1 uncharacterized protein LOC131011175 isoform X2 [Salvia miltiorrhiza]XP_057794959.1 uncharacterized protein LOC131011175 isoform X2 [Salvia miltiorrhiza]